MGNSVTRAMLRTRAINHADMAAQLGQSQFIGIDEVNGYINDSISELHDLLVTRFADYYRRKYPFTGTAGTSEYPLPPDYFKKLALYYREGTTDGSQVYEVEEFMLSEMPMYMNNPQLSVAYNQTLMHRIMDDRIIIIPAPAANGLFELWYVPQYTPLINDDDALTIQVVGGWEEYIVVDVAIKCRDKGELSTDRLVARKGALTQRIITAGSKRSAGRPQRVTDVYANPWRRTR